MNLPAHDHHGGCGCYQQPHPMPDNTVYLPPQQAGGPYTVHPYPPHAAYPVPQTDRAAQVAKYAGAAAVVVFTVMAVALFAVAIAISAVALTTCLLVLRALWREIQGDGSR
ncbi:hypothetical protein ACL02R_09350 [Streptomyces sp. MS19]|uniref:hypothetical protein n=1 Tax=Streptomyces sp. MS19 TaxID=3385972 RepID=UPI00399FCC22